MIYPPHGQNIVKNTVYTPIGAVVESYQTNKDQQQQFGRIMPPSSLLLIVDGTTQEGLKLSNGYVYRSDYFKWDPRYGFNHNRDNHSIYRMRGKTRSRYLRFGEPELDEISEAILTAYLQGAFSTPLSFTVTEEEHRANQAEMAFIRDIIKSQEENARRIKEFRENRGDGGWRGSAVGSLKIKWS